MAGMSPLTSTARYPLVPLGSSFRVVGAEGVHLRTDDGRDVLDAAGGAIVANIGWGRPEVAEAVAAAARRHTYSIPPWSSPERDELADRLVDRWLPAGLVHATFVSGGSESVDAAIRLAVHHHRNAGDPRRTKVLGRSNSYHGVTLSALSVGGHASRRGPYEAVLGQEAKLPSISDHRFDPDAPPTAEEVRAVLEHEDPSTVAALIVEPITGSAAGVVSPPPGELAALRKLCDETGIFLIADEVMSGFGRSGVRFGVDHEGVRPDIMVGGKGLAGGYAPMGGVYASDEVVAPLAEAGEPLFFYTFSGHPPSCAAADAVLRIMEDEELVDRSAQLGDVLESLLTDALGEHANVAQIRVRGLWAGVEVAADPDGTPFPEAARVVDRIVAAGLERGVFYYPAGRGGAVRDTVMIGPAFTITELDLERLSSVLVDSIDAAVADAQAGAPA
ncbi:MAG: aminotransferase class III-fold pyridoxal phosphate-dependent enzyme [Actinomycetota bacterium]